MLKNIDKLKKSKVAVKKHWLNPNLLILDFDEIFDAGSVP
jgi:hypothetical protein